MKSPVKTSPLKSPAKRSRKINDENFSPTKGQESFSSPSKKGESSPDKQSQLSDRKSQRRKRITVDTEDQRTSPMKSTTSPDKLNVPAETSPLKSCPKSPLKRMKNLEDKDNTENQENIEQTYLNAHEVESQEDKEEDVAFDSEPKCILGAKYNTPELTET